MAAQAHNTLKRYTTLSNAIDILTQRRLTLLSPATWQDQNDIAYMKAYCRHKALDAIYAACFTQSAETFHHWGVFASGSESVRVDFNKSALLDSLQHSPGYDWRDVEYRTLNVLKAHSVLVDDLPYLKRHAFKDEREFRLLYAGPSAHPVVHYVPIDITWVTGITLSPWLPENLIDVLKSALRTLSNCPSIKLQRTNLRSHPDWIAAADKAQPHAGAT